VHLKPIGGPFLSARQLHKHLILIAIFLSFPVSAQTLDFVLDLDGVLIFKPAADAPPEKVIEADGKKYRVADWAGEFLQFLADIPNSRITFFSSLPNKRNIEALQKIVLPNGKTAVQIAIGENGELRIFDTELLLNNEGHNQKDLDKLPFQFSRNRILLLDDQDGFIVRTQRRNYLRVSNNSDAFGHYPEIFEVFRERDKLIAERARIELPRLAAIINSALNTIGPDRDRFVEAISAIQWQTTPGDGYQFPKLNHENFSDETYAKGKQLLSEKSKDCVRLVTP